MTKFTRGLLRQRTSVLAWVGLLVLVNLSGLLFWDHVEARVVVLTLAAGGVLMEILTAVQGFTRLLGLGHVLWIPMLVWLESRLPGVPGTDAFGVWLRVVMALNGLSLVIDVADVARWLRGERAPM